VLVLFLEEVRRLVESVIHSGGYAGIILAMVAENLFPPIPSEVIMPFSGSLIAQGKLSAVGVLLSGTIGSLIGALIIYSIGRSIGSERILSWIQRYGKFIFLKEETYQKMMDLFRAHGMPFILFGRLVPAFRSVISLPAGVERMKMSTFLLYTLVGTTLWNVVLMVAGIFLGHNWEAVIHVMDMYENIILIIVGILVSIFILRKTVLRKNEA